MAEPAKKSRRNKYRVIESHPKNTGSKEHPKFGPSGERIGTKERVYTKADVAAYERATGERRGRRRMTRRAARKR